MNIEDFNEHISYLKEQKKELEEITNTSIHDTARLIDLYENIRSHIAFFNHGESDKFSTSYLDSTLEFEDKIEEAGKGMFVTAFQITRNEILRITEKYIQQMEKGMLEHLEEIRTGGKK